MRITQAKKEDARELFRLEQQLFSKENFPISLRMFRYHLARNICFVAKEDKRIIGYILLLKRKRWLKLYSLGMAREHRGKKIASQLLAFALQSASTQAYKKVLLEVRSDNARAITLYESFGFKTLHTSAAFYGDGCAAFIMQKRLEEFIS
ncbi:MAG: N-acetyltransferase [Sulfurimonas sp.]|jgi:ribosomal-protein-alanine N-acetyltransferase|nr:N-acetyltransferase [Sulfurimonas sp.]